MAFITGCTKTEPVTIKADDVQYGDTPGKTVKGAIDDVKNSAAGKSHTHKSSEVTGFNQAAKAAMGTKGSSNALNHDRYAEADLSASATIKALQVEIATLKAMVPTGKCPAGYTQDSTVTKYVVCKNGKDEMVKVGDFWIDRYEMTVVDAKTYNSGKCSGSGTTYGTAKDDYPSTFPKSGNWTAPLYACSVKGVLPSARMTWFQVQQACLLAGKHLCTNAEWQGAASGTLEAYCNVNTSVKVTGNYPSCMSRWGAFDMVGNVAEIVAWWAVAGKEWGTSSSIDHATPWPTGFGDGKDETTNIEGQCFNAKPVYPYVKNKGIPAAPSRGGGYSSGADKAGIFAISMTFSPAAPSASGRCCRR